MKCRDFVCKELSFLKYKNNGEFRDVYLIRGRI